MWGGKVISLHNEDWQLGIYHFHKDWLFRFLFSSPASWKLEIAGGLDAVLR